MCKRSLLLGLCVSENKYCLGLYRTWQKILASFQKVGFFNYYYFYFYFFAVAEAGFYLKFFPILQAGLLSER